MSEAAASHRGRSVHDLPGFHKPRRTHNHCLATLPIDLAFLDAFVLDVIEELLSEQRH